MRILTALLITSVSLLTWPAQVAHAAAGLPMQVAGTWQGTLQAPAPPLRIVLQISRDLGTWKAIMYSIDRSPDQIPVAAISITGSKVRLKVRGYGIYDGTLSTDHSSINGTWTRLGTRAQLNLRRATRATEWPLYNTGYTVRFVTVQPDVKLEVLDWGGSGRPVILLAGQGNTAHVFDKFAQKLTTWYHVYGITRRGFGASSAPTTGYSADRLGNDVLAVMAALKIERPVLIGHSIAGEELSYVGSHYPQKVAGLVYLDAGYAYAFYDASTMALKGSPLAGAQGTVTIDDLRCKLTQLTQMFVSSNGLMATRLINELIAGDLSRVRRQLPVLKRELEGAPGPESRPSPINQAIASGYEEFTRVTVPVLAIFADPHAFAPTVPPQSRAQVRVEEAGDKKIVEEQIAVVRQDAPMAHIARLPHANHYVFISNQSAVLRDIRGFIRTLPRP